MKGRSQLDFNAYCPVHRGMVHADEHLHARIKNLLPDSCCAVVWNAHRLFVKLGCGDNPGGRAGRLNWRKVDKQHCKECPCASRAALDGLMALAR